MKQHNHLRLTHSTIVVVAAAAVTTMMTTGTYAFTPSVTLASSGIRNPIDVQTRVSSRNHLFAVSKANNNDLNHYTSSLESTTSTDQKTVSTQPTPVLFEAIYHYFLNEQKNLKMIPSSLSRSAATITLGALLVTSTLLIPTNSADAAMSGGRMGGSFSSPSSSRSSSSYGGGRSSYGGGRSSSSYSPGRSYSNNNNYYYSRPSSTIVAPIFVPSPFAPVVPYYGGYGGGGGAGVISYNRGPSLVDLLIFGGIGFFVLKTISDTARSAIDGTSSSWTSSSENAVVSALGTGTSVVQISIALNVPNRDDPNSILNVLNRLAETSKTDSRVGVQQLTSSVAIELLRRKSSFTGGYTQAQHYDNTNAGQREYNQLSVKERSKFEKELVSKYSGIDYNRQTSPNTNNGLTSNNTPSSSSTMAVVTILLNIAGDTTSNNIPKTIRSTQDLEKTLQRIASDVIIDDCLTSAEILWTPEDRTESLSIRDIVVDYPELRNV